MSHSTTPIGAKGSRRRRLRENTDTMRQRRATEEEVKIPQEHGEQRPYGKVAQEATACLIAFRI